MNTSLLALLAISNILCSYSLCDPMEFGNNEVIKTWKYQYVKDLHVKIDDVIISDLKNCDVFELEYNSKLNLIRKFCSNDKVILLFKNDSKKIKMLPIKNHTAVGSIEIETDKIIEIIFNQSNTPICQILSNEKKSFEDSTKE